MPENGDSTVLVLVMLCLGGLVLVILLLAAIFRRLGGIERSLAAKGTSAKAGAEAPDVEADPGGAFESFLKEDPARRLLPKREQFAAYRKWRQRSGLNWSKS